MKATINRLTYNTETATELAEWDNGASCSDFSFCEETLYRTAKGNHFLLGVGGALSKYSESCEGGRCRGGGKQIIPISEDEAVEWCESTDNQEAIDQHFSHLTEDA